MLRSSKMLFAVTLVALAAAWIVPPPSAVRAEDPKPKAGEEKEGSTSFWMDRKLRLSQELLAGITMADFDKIVKSGEAMKGLNKVEAFVRGRTPGYRTQLQIFEESLDEIVRQADKDNVEGAALAFTQLTISCVNCHKQLRATK